MIWKTLGTVAPGELIDARLQLHHAAQVVASAGAHFIAPEPDDSHPNLGWDESLGALVGRALPGAGFRAGLRLADLSLLLIDEAGTSKDELSLDGRTLEDGHAWLAGATRAAGMEVPGAGLTRVAYEIPAHPTGEGAAFSAGPSDAFAELARWFANGHEALGASAPEAMEGAVVRCWPHHFDLGALVVVATQPDGGLAKSIGIGLSPGDDGYAEPYWYVSPWPYPDADVLPELGGGGHWHTEGHTSAILTGSAMLEGPSSGQADRLSAFLESAIAASRLILAN